MLEEAVDALMNTIPSMITRGSLAEAAIEKKLAMLYDVKKSNLTILELPGTVANNARDLIGPDLFDLID